MLKELTKFTNASDFHKIMHKCMNENEDAAKRAVTPDQHLAIWGYVKAAGTPALGDAPEPINDDDLVATARTKEHDISNCIISMRTRSKKKSLRIQNSKRL
jgi:hypothetical protein